MERKFSIFLQFVQLAGRSLLPPSAPPPPPPLPSCNLHYFTKWGSRALAAYENQAILFCFAAALHGSSHSTGIPAETTYDVCCRRCMYTRYVFICWYSIPCSTGDHIASRTGVIFWFSGQTNCEAGVERGVPFPVGRACLALLVRFSLSRSLP